MAGRPILSHSSQQINEATFNDISYDIESKKNIETDIFFGRICKTTATSFHALSEFYQYLSENTQGREKYIAKIIVLDSVSHNKNNLLTNLITSFVEWIRGNTFSSFLKNLDKDTKIKNAVIIIKNFMENRPAGMESREKAERILEFLLKQENEKDFETCIGLSTFLREPTALNFHWIQLPEKEKQIEIKDLNLSYCVKKLNDIKQSYIKTATPTKEIPRDERCVSVRKFSQESALSNSFGNSFGNTEEEKKEGIKKCNLLITIIEEIKLSTWSNEIDLISTLNNYDNLINFLLKPSQENFNKIILPQKDSERAAIPAGNSNPNSSAKEHKESDSPQNKRDGSISKKSSDLEIKPTKNTDLTNSKSEDSDSEGIAGERASRPLKQDQPAKPEDTRQSRSKEDIEPKFSVEITGEQKGSNVTPTSSIDQKKPPKTQTPGSEKEKSERNIPELEKLKTIQTPEENRLTDRTNTDSENYPSKENYSNSQDSPLTESVEEKKETSIPCEPAVELSLHEIDNKSEPQQLNQNQFTTQENKQLSPPKNEPRIKETTPREGGQETPAIPAEDPSTEFKQHPRESVKSDSSKNLRINFQSPPPEISSERIAEENPNKPQKQKLTRKRTYTPYNPHKITERKIERSPKKKSERKQKASQEFSQKNDIEELSPSYCLKKINDFITSDAEKCNFLCKQISSIDSQIWSDISKLTEEFNKTPGLLEFLTTSTEENFKKIITPKAKDPPLQPLEKTSEQEPVPPQKDSESKPQPLKRDQPLKQMPSPSKSVEEKEPKPDSELTSPTIPPRDTPPVQLEKPIAEKEPSLHQIDSESEPQPLNQDKPATPEDTRRSPPKDENVEPTFSVRITRKPIKGKKFKKKQKENELILKEQKAKREDIITKQRSKSTKFMKLKLEKQWETDYENLSTLLKTLFLNKGSSDVTARLEGKHGKGVKYKKTKIDLNTELKDIIDINALNQNWNELKQVVPEVITFFSSCDEETDDPHNILNTFLFLSHPVTSEYLINGDTTTTFFKTKFKEHEQKMNISSTRLFESDAVTYIFQYTHRMQSALLCICAQITYCSESEEEKEKKFKALDAFFPFDITYYKNNSMSVFDSSISEKIQNKNLVFRFSKLEWNLLNYLVENLDNLNSLLKTRKNWTIQLTTSAYKTLKKELEKNSYKSNILNDLKKKKCIEIKDEAS